MYRQNKGVTSHLRYRRLLLATGIQWLGTLYVIKGIIKLLNSQRWRCLAMFSITAQAVGSNWISWRFDMVSISGGFERAADEQLPSRPLQRRPPQGPMIKNEFWLGIGIQPLHFFHTTTVGTLLVNYLFIFLKNGLWPEGPLGPNLKK